MRGAGHRARKSWLWNETTLVSVPNPNICWLCDLRRVTLSTSRFPYLCTWDDKAYLIRRSGELLNITHAAQARLRASAQQVLAIITITTINLLLQTLKYIYLFI